jgi:hypothetical protein
VRNFYRLLAASEEKVNNGTDTTMLQVVTHLMGFKSKYSFSNQCYNDTMKFKWMYSQEKELKKHRVTMRNKARVEGCITKTFMCKEITNFSSKNFTCANNMNAHTMRYHIVEEVPLSELSIFQWKGKSVGAPSAHYVMDDE